jgi:hypothetical protein
MSFSALLKTTRTLERAVQFFGPHRSGVEAQAVGWLKMNGQAGDAFYFSELRAVPAGSLTMSGRDKNGLIETASEVAVE